MPSPDVITERITTLNILRLRVEQNLPDGEVLLVLEKPKPENGEIWTDREHGVRFSVTKFTGDRDIPTLRLSIIGRKRGAKRLTKDFEAALGLPCIKSFGSNMSVIYWDR